MSTINLSQLLVRVLERLNKQQKLDPNENALLIDDLSQLHQILSSNPPTISATSPDFNSLLLQLHDRIKRLDTWKDFGVSSTGRTLLELVAAVGAFNQTGISVAFREAFSDTAIRQTSQYTIARTLGARIARKTPARAKVWLRRSATNTAEKIPPFTQFVVEGLEFFNAKEIVFPPGESLIPLNVTTDVEGKVSKKDDFISSLYLADVTFPNDGQFYYPCSGIIEVEDGENFYTGEVKITSDASSPDNAFGSIYFAEQVLLSANANFKITLSQYNGTQVYGTFKPRTSSALLKFPGAIPFQIKRTGVGASIVTPAIGTANIPETMAVITNEDLQIAAQKYLLPEYLNQSVLLYDTDILLHSGRVQKTRHIVKNRASFYSINIGVEGFFIADNFLYVEVFDGNGVQVFERATKPIWAYGPKDLVFVDSTLGNGDAVLTFGDGIHGKALEEGWQVAILYVLTKGAVGNGSPADSKVSCPSFGLEGGTLTTTYGGSDEKPASYYRAVAPSTFKAKSRMITASDHEDFILNLPGVADVAVLRQKDLAPHDIRLMNRLTVVLLPFSPQLLVYPTNSLKSGQPFDSAIVNPKDPNEPNHVKFSDLELKDLELLMRESAYSAIDLDVHRSPIPIPVTIKIRAFCYRQFSIDTVRSRLAINVKKLFERKRGILGRSLLIVDITNACKIDEVDYVEVLEPSFDVILGTASSDTFSFLCLEDSPDISVEYTARRT